MSKLVWSAITENKTKCCGNCKHHKSETDWDEDHYCENERGFYYQCYTPADFGCEEYEKG